MIRLVCSDIDNTLLKNSVNTGDQILGKLKAKGVLPMLATGRSVTDVLKLFPEAAENVVIASYDGALVTVGGTVISDRPIGGDIVNAFFDSFPKNGPAGCSLIFYTAADCFVTGGSAEKALINANTMSGRISKVAHPKDITSAVYKISVYSDSPADFEYLFADWRDYMQCVYRKDRWCEFVSSGTDKGFALNIVMEKFMIDRGDVLAFGDGENDFTMLEAAGCSYAVEGSPADFEEKADFVTKDAARTIEELVLKG
ncbi:MAG: HAD family phosphatase [Clostridia bacterium]|nr:HAD family phosphatase [Clostridia bacterium]MCR5695092.1 Cof-type HAD-IIB family hydrolase [Clostridia bacterium]